MHTKGILIILSGPSGVGKGTVSKELAKDSLFELSVSRTTRQPREGEINGVHYHFTTHAEFENLINANGFFEYASYKGNFYGTPIENVQQRLNEGKNVILEIEVIGASKVMDFYKGDYISIFMLPPGADELEGRLRARNTESEADIKERMRIAASEIDRAASYDYLIINNTVKKAVSDIKTIVAAESLKTKRNDNAIQKFKGEMK
jgi:guanylate kinase